MTEPVEEVVIVDQDDFESLYRREYPALHAVAAAMSGGMKGADDLVQDTMLRAFVHWRKVKQLQRPGGWCHRVLINLCRNWHRRLRTEARWLSHQRAEEPVAPEVSADAVAFSEALRTLAMRPRSAVALFYLGDRSVSEVATILGVPEGTVRSDLSRARAALVQRLEEGR